MARRYQGIIVFFLFLYNIEANNKPVIVEGPNTTPVTTEITRPTSSSTKIPLGRYITIQNDSFILDGKPLRLISGSLHYFRVPAEYWRDRLHKFRAAGLNAVATYVEWSFHEPEEREYKFEGDHDLAKFIKLAAEEGLLVLLRPGPYICAERDLGGLPYWLLGKYPKISLRSTDKDFIAESKTWFDKLFSYMSPLLYGNGGPIILVQVENEYGSYGSDKAYMDQMRDILLEHVRDKALLYTTDGPSRHFYIDGSVKGALTTIDFGTETNVTSVFTKLYRYNNGGPMVNSEFYPGWLTHWSEKLSTIDTKEVVKTLKEMLDYNASLNFYVFFGGTNFGFTAGANYDHRYQPDITSYDYDAPLNEAGDPTPKYYAIREVLSRYMPATFLPPTTVSNKGSYGPVIVGPHIEILSQKGRTTIGKRYDKVNGTSLPTFEKLRQFSGLVLYETYLSSLNFNDTLSETHLLAIYKPRDRIYVYIDGVYKGIISRMHKIYTLPINVRSNSTLSLLVENQGRINFGNRLHDFKGILGPVLLDNKALDGEWTIYGYPLQDTSSFKNILMNEYNELIKGPVIFEGKFVIPGTDEVLDTFFDPTAWGKGYVWINGHNLGRYWPDQGPQVTLYVPGIWLKRAPFQNVVQILELEKAPPDFSILFRNRPIMNRKL